MKKILLTAVGLCASLLTLPAAVPAYDADASKTAARNDIANWMSYLPDDLFVAHVSIPGTHDTATAEGWASSTGASMSTTQEKTIDQQLAGGIRAFDFRPGMNNDVLWCNHGTDRTTLKLADAMAKLSAYLDAHPREFFVIHLFRGNVYRAGECSTGNKILGGKDSASDQAKYNTLFNELFNTGDFAPYIIDYSPYLKVKDIRSKIVIFRRDRIDFAHVAKAGNLIGWPGSEEEWSEWSQTAVVNASDEAISGIVRATDVSSPDNENELQIELNSLTNLYNYNCNQTRPNDAKRAGAYKPYWTMMFTSGAYNGENTNGYLKNAEYTNPHFTNLIKNADKKGPTGIVFSDWVLTDSHDGYATMGVDLVPAIIDNNFDYITDYILDDELFAEGSENFWEGQENTEYFLRNVATGQFLYSGADWGTHAVLHKEYGIRIKISYDKTNNAYQLHTTQGTTGGIGDNFYVDNGSPAFFSAKREGSGRYSFTLGNTALTVTTPPRDYIDGTEYFVEGADYQQGNLMQQWELVPVETYFKTTTATASPNNPVDVSYMIRGGRFLPNDTENWSGTTHYQKAIFGSAIHASYIYYDGTNIQEDKNFALYCTNTSSNSSYNSNTVWSISHKDEINLAGVYKLKFKAAYNTFDLSDNTLTFNVNGTSYRSQLEGKSVNIDPAAVIASFRDDPDKYTIEIDMTLDANGSITFDLSKTKTNKVTALFLDDVELFYYGPEPKPLSVAGTYNEVDRTFAFNATAADGSDVTDDSVISYLISTDAADTAPDMTDATTLETPTVDLLSECDGGQIYIWAVATSISGRHTPSPATLVFDGIVDPKGATVEYQPVHDASQLVPGYWYLLVAEHEIDGHHAMARTTDADGHHHSVHVTLTDDGYICADEAGFKNVHEFQLSGTDGAWTLTSKDRALTLTNVSLQAIAPRSRAAAPSYSVTADGASWGFSQATKTFGNAPDLHTTPLAMYTTGDDKNTSVDTIAADTTADDPVEYYTLQGIRITGTPAPGTLCIRRQGPRATKLLIKY